VTINGVTNNGRVSRVFAFTDPTVLKQDQLPACTP